MQYLAHYSTFTLVFSWLNNWKKGEYKLLLLSIPDVIQLNVSHHGQEWNTLYKMQYLTWNTTDCYFICWLYCIILDNELSFWTYIAIVLIKDSNLCWQLVLCSLNLANLWTTFLGLQSSVKYLIGILYLSTLISNIKLEI